MTIQSKVRKGNAYMGLDRHIAELLDLLNMEIRSFNALNELLILEEKALISSDSAALADITGRQGDILSSIECLEKSRLEILNHIASAIRRDARGLNVTELTKLASTTDLKKELIDTGRILSALYSDLKRRKASNTVLIRQSILMVESDIRLLMNIRAGSSGKSTLYSPSQTVTPNSGSVLFDGTI